MQTFNSTSALGRLNQSGCVVAIGNFDGVHYGHQQILKKAKRFAVAKKLKLCVLSFEPHPVKILAPAVAPHQIQTRAQKIQSLHDAGVDVVVLQKFDAEFAKITPEDFFKIHLCKNLNANAIFVGYDFTFGKKRLGTTETLETLAHANGIPVKVIAAQMRGQTLVSSSLIRKLLQDGLIKDANFYLTRPYEIVGTVVPGFKRGTSLGIHTANLQAENESLLADGVYATFAICKNQKFLSVTNIGLNPTFENTQRSIETHIFAFTKNIYNQTLKLWFVEKLRDEIKFANPTALVKQIEKDISAAKHILEKNEF